MANALVRASLKSLWVEFNGDKDDSLADDLAELDELKEELEERESNISENPNPRAIRRIEKLYEDIVELEDEAQDNAIVCKLSYPRSGSSSVEAIKRVRLPSGKTNGEPPIHFEHPTFLENGIFKEVIQGECLLQIGVSDADKKNKFLLFFRRVLATAFSAATKTKISDISGVVANSTATILSKDIAEAITGDPKKRVQLVATSKKVKLSVNNGQLGQLDVETGEGIEYSDGILKLSLHAPLYLEGPDGYINKGTGNGEIEIALTSEVM